MQLAAFVVAFLLLPTINLVSINLSRIMERSPEIGVRKAFGATRADLVGQFILENMFLCLVGGGLALVAAAWSWSWIEANGLDPLRRLPAQLPGLSLRPGAGLLSSAFCPGPTRPGACRACIRWRP